MTENKIGTQLAPEKLGLKTHLCYGVSQFGITAITTAFGIHALIYYHEILGFSTALFGLVMLIAQIYDAVSDPLMGHISDRTTWHRGRRRPFFLLGSIPMGIAFFLAFSPPKIETPKLMFIYLTAVILLMYTGRTVFETPYLALMPELTLDYDERTKLSGFKQWFGTLGDATGAILPMVFILLIRGYLKGKHVPEDIIEGESSPIAHFGYALMACVVVIVFSAVTRWGTSENPRLAQRSQVSIRESIKAVANNRPYLIFIFASTMAQIGNNIATYLIRYITKYWFLDEGLAVQLFLCFFAGALCAVPLWVKLAYRLGKKSTYVINLTGYGIVLSSIMLIPPEARLVITVIMFIAGSFNVGLWVISGTIAPDIIEWDEYQTGRRREGIYSGVWTFMIKAGIGLGLLVVGVGLQLINLDAALDVQTESTLLGLRMMFGPFAGMFLFLGALVFLAFPITKRKHEEIRRLIDERKAAEEAE